MEPEATAEHLRLQRESSAGEDWKQFGPYLAERQWGTVREDYSKDGACWDYFPHDHARSRAYRWGEDGLLGFCDREARLCFGLALWNGRDGILKERLFGLAAPEGNHGEDVKELYYYLDSTPTHSYFKALYKYPMEAYPYERLVREGRERSILDPEFEIEDSGAFDHGRYFDVTAEYGKASPTDIAIRIEIANRSSDRARIHVIPQLWFRNTWSWGRGAQAEYGPKPRLWLGARRGVALDHATLGRYLWEAGVSSSQVEPELIFTENETNVERLFGGTSPTPYVKDAFHEYVVHGRDQRVNPANEGTKAGAHYELEIDGHDSVTLIMRLASQADRTAGAAALKQLLREAHALAADNRQIVIFPQGTRTAPGETTNDAPYQAGIAALYQLLKLPTTPIALNSGLVWGRRSFIKRPGKIIIELLPEIPSGLSRVEFMRRLEDAIEPATRRLEAETEPQRTDAR